MAKGTLNSSVDIFTSESGIFLWDSGRMPSGEKSTLLFAKPYKTLCLLPSFNYDEVVSFFRQLQNGIDSGMYAAGWMAYEAGYLLIPKLRRLLETKKPSLPLAWFGLYTNPMRPEADFCNNLTNKRHLAITLHLDTSREEFYSSIDKIHSYIRSGDTYQINYTVRGSFAWKMPGALLYSLLRTRQQVDYAAFLRPFPDLEILSLSPELFFAQEGVRIRSKPMKGTAPRGKNPDEDTKIAHGLKEDKKNRAENVMIVDLLRNDLGRVCEIGSVKVPELFEIECYETLFQMTSLVEGKLKGSATVFDVFNALFPCGSITGAPKIRSMEIIAELEKAPRGVYTGAIGFITPRHEAIFNVAIRTVTLQNGKAEVGIGAGITIGSDPESEYEETILKARFISQNIL